MSSHVMPVPLYAIPGPLVHQSSMMGYPLIPAPLGQVPSPIIPPPNRKVGLHRICLTSTNREIFRWWKLTNTTNPSQEAENRLRNVLPNPDRRARNVKWLKRTLPEHTQVRSHFQQKTNETSLNREYLGLDRAMAEEFINICEMKNASLCSSSDTSTSSCNDSSCQSPCHSNSDANSQNCLLNN